MEQYYNAGYYLIKKRPVNFGNDKEKIVSTCSGCINTIVFDLWAFSCAGSQISKEKKKELGLNDEKIDQILNWVQNKFNAGQLKWGNVFPDLKMAKEYKNLFHNREKDIDIYSIEFSGTEKNNLIKDFEVDKNSAFDTNDNQFGLRENLLKENKVTDNPLSDFLGFDFIGVEGDGSFHSFYCHDFTKELVDTFGLKLNENGLFENIPDPNLIRDYINDPETGLEPVPWYIVKVVRNDCN